MNRISSLFIRFKKCFLFLGLMILIFSLSITGGYSKDQEESQKPKKIGMIEKERVRMILIDVVVENPLGERIAGLSKEYFHLFIDGLEKPIATFDAHCKKVLVKEEEVLQAEADVIEEVEPRYIILYFDGAHLSLGGRYESIKAAEKFIQEGMEDHDHVMLAIYANRLHVVQHFTNDKQQLMDALLKLEGDPKYIDTYAMTEWIKVREGNVSHSLMGITPKAEMYQKMMDDYKNTKRMNIKEIDSEAEAWGYAQENHDKTQRAIECLRSIFALLEPINAKKAVVYFSDSFRDVPGLFYLYNVSDQYQLMSYRSLLSIEPELRALINDANSSRVSFYSVDALGLTAPGQREQEHSVFSALSSLSTDTGGKVFKRTNDLTMFIPVVKEDLSCYYTLGYSPVKKADGKHHALRITIDKPLLKVRSKSGYTDFTEEELKSRELLSALLLPHLYQDIKVVTDIFPLKPVKDAWETIFQVSMNLEEFKLLKYPLKEIDFLCSLYGNNEMIKEINQHIKLTLNLEEIDKAPDWIIYQEKCRLESGKYNLVAAIKDTSTEVIGASEKEISIPEISEDTFTIGSVLLKGSLPLEVPLIEKKKSEDIDHSQFLIRPDKRFSSLETVAIMTPICSTNKNPGESLVEGKVKRRILRDDQLLLEFDEISLNDPPDPKSGCYNIVDIIEPEALESGFYTYELELLGKDLNQKANAIFSIR